MNIRPWLTQQLIALWYAPPSLLSQLLSPFTWFYRFFHCLRKTWYQRRQSDFAIPIIIVGNLTVGGSGKTPLVIWLAQFLIAQGWRPGIVSRGYGGKASHYPISVTAKSDPSIVGDEAVLIARQTHCPMLVAPKRVQAVKQLLSEFNCNVIISDDGLQHYALARHIEIVVIDGVRRFGNEQCLPVGPLREPLTRLASVDFMVTNGEAEIGEFAMQLVPQVLYNLQETAMQASAEDFAGQAIHAIAGIGHPARFFAQLQALGFSIWPHAFADHHLFKPTDLQFADEAAIVMTEKDAVKCESFIDYRCWCLPVRAEVDAQFGELLLAKLRSIHLKINKSEN